METQNKYLKRQNYNTLAMKHREGNGNPLQYSCLENPMDGEAWQATVHGVAKSQTLLGDFTLTFTFTFVGVGGNKEMSGEH